MRESEITNRVSIYNQSIGSSKIPGWVASGLYKEIPLKSKILSLHVEDVLGDPSYTGMIYADGELMSVSGAKDGSFSIDNMVSMSELDDYPGKGKDMLIGIRNDLHNGNTTSVMSEWNAIITAEHADGAVDRLKFGRPFMNMDTPDSYLLEKSSRLFPHVMLWIEDLIRIKSEDEFHSVHSNSAFSSLSRDEKLSRVAKLADENNFRAVSEIWSSDSGVRDYLESDTSGYPYSVSFDEIDSIGEYLQLKNSFTDWLDDRYAGRNVADLGVKLG